MIKYILFNATLSNVRFEFLTVAALKFKSSGI
jgi:hypothetical protein